MSDAARVQELAQMQFPEYSEGHNDRVANVACDYAAEQTARLRAALRPFASGGDWGTWKAYLVNGPPSREDGVRAAKQITVWQAAVDVVLTLLADHEA